MEAQNQDITTDKARIQWAARGYNLIKKRGKVMLTTEIATIILKNDGIIINNNYARRVYLHPLSAAFRTLVKKGVLKQTTKIGFRSAIYGLSEWFDEHGNIKEEYDVEYFQD